MLLRNLGEVYKKGLSSMSDLYKRIEDLCNENNVTITTMCKESGASRASLSDLKMGRKQKLSADTLSKIARFFGVSVDYLLGTEKEKPLINDDEELTEYVQMLKTRPEMRMLFQLSKDATKEDVEAAVRIIEALRNK